MNRSTHLVKLPAHWANHPVPALLVNISTLQISDSNKSAQTFLGTSKKRLLAKSLGELMLTRIAIPKSRLRQYGTLQFTSSAGQVSANVIGYKPSSNDNVALFELHPAENGSVRSDGVRIDLTDSFERNQQSLLPKSRYQNLVESIDGIVWQAIADTMEFTFVSDKVESILGYSAAQWLADENFWASHIIEIDRAAALLFCKNEIKEKRNHQFEYRMLAADGRVVWLHDQVWVNGNTVGGVMFDITKRKQAEVALATSEANLKAIVDNTDTAYVLYDTELNILSYNKLADSFANNYLRDRLEVGAPGLRYFREDRKAIASKYFKKALQGESVSYQTTYGDSENPAHLFGRMFSVHDEMGSVVGVIFAVTDITRFEEARIKVERTQKLYESLVKSQTSFLIRTDMQGYYSFVNKSFLDHFGFIEADIIGKHSFETIHPEDWNICEQAVMSCINNPGKVVKAAFRKPTKDNRFLWTEWEFVTIVNEEDGLTEIQCLGADITERLKNQKSVEQLAQRLSVATQAGSLGIWEYNPVTRTCVWDKRTYEMYGIEDGKPFTFKDFKSWVYPQDWPTVKAKLLESLTERISFTYRIIRQTDQSIRYIQAEGMHQHESPSLVGVNSDVTERVTIENKLIQTSSRLKLATQSAKIGVWEWDLTTNAIQWDEMMFELYGLENDQDHSFRKFEMCVHPDDKRMVEEQILIVLEQKIPVDSSFRIIRQTDKAIRHIKSFGVYDPARIFYTGVNLDITDLIEKENTISQAKSQIEQLQLNALRSAMNPHFIFNALNSIQFFITQNQRENAIGYLSKFSKLIRGILDSSTYKKSTISSELELIKYYVEIEQLRFENKFDFILKVNPSVDIEMIELPALLLQPFVENAILHGLYTKVGRGLLEINVDETAHFYKVTIHDNGIGRAASDALRKTNFPEHKSQGLALNKERVELTNQKFPLKITIHDLMENERAMGTAVEVLVGKEEVVSR